MTAFAMAVWLSLFALVVSAAGLRQRPVVIDFASLTVHRRGQGGGQFTLPVPRVFKPSVESRSPLFDAIIVPSARGAANLPRAAETARNAGSCLVVLASGRTDPAEVRNLLHGAGWMPGTYHVLGPVELALLPVPRLLTMRHPYAVKLNDVSQKRNAGLVMARTLGWQSVLFLDDDVQAISRDDLLRAAALLDGRDRGGVKRRCVGWTFEGLRDFSMAGHANSYLSDSGMPFIGGGAMALSCDDPVQFFPPVYNEDQLMVLETLRAHPGSACVAGRLKQDECDPFSDLRRAESQEFGECLLEAWANGATREQVTTPEFWQGVVQDRGAHLDDLEKHLVDLGVTNGAQAIKAARCAHRADWPESLAQFAEAWLADQTVWRDLLMAMPKPGA